MGGCCARACSTPQNTGAGVWADTAYRSQQNETFLERHGFISHIHRRRRPGSAAACPRPPRQRQAVTRACSGGACLRGAEAGEAASHPNHRSRPSPHEDRHGQPRLQHPPPGPTPQPGPRLTVQPRGSSAPGLLNQPNLLPQTPGLAPESSPPWRKMAGAGHQNLTMPD